MKRLILLAITAAGIFTSCSKPAKTGDYSCKVTYSVTYTVHSCINVGPNIWYDTFYSYTANEINNIAEDSSYNRYKTGYIGTACGSTPASNDNVKYSKTTTCTKFK